MVLNRVLLFILGALLSIFLITGGIFILTHRNEKTAPVEQSSDQSIFTIKQKPVYKQIGQLRSSTKADGKNSTAVIVITPYLEYETEDVSFYEEKKKKSLKIRQTIQNYFSGYTLKQINQKGEDLVKAELLEQINSLLVLQKLSAIYFTEYQFF